MIDYQAEIKRLEEELKASDKWQYVLGIIIDRLNVRSMFNTSQYAHDWLSKTFAVDYYGQLTKAIADFENGKRPSLISTTRSKISAPRAPRHKAHTELPSGVTCLPGKRLKPYRSQVKLNGKWKHVGYFATAQEAIEAQLESKKPGHE
jgi:hypothetical protein